jgi:hypothetical protein
MVLVVVRQGAKAVLHEQRPKKVMKAKKAKGSTRLEST